MKYKSYILILLFIIIIIQSYLLFTINRDVKKIKCDLVKSVFAEREYIYPILRTIDDPDKYGKGILNPITNDKFYYCK